MKLHKVMFRHCSPKDSEYGIKTYVIAESEDLVMRQIDKIYNFDGWLEDQGEEEVETYTIYDKEWNELGEESKIERVMRLRGELSDEWDHDYSDSYYGLTFYGWDEGREISGEDAAKLLSLGIALDWRDSVLAEQEEKEASHDGED